MKNSSDHIVDHNIVAYQIIEINFDHIVDNSIAAQQE